MALYLTNGTYIDWQTLEMTPTHLKVDEGDFGTVEAVETIPPNARVLDCSGKLVTRSFGCGHHHVYSALARGMPAPRHTPSSFYEILKHVWWHLDRCLDAEAVAASALVTALYCAKNGVTLVVDHHSSPFAVEGSLAAIADAFERVGVSALVCCELSDRDGVEARDRGLRETENFLASGRPGLVGLHASFTVGDKLLHKAVRLAQQYDSGIHVHVAEDKIDQRRCLEEHGCRVVRRFEATGVLDFKKTILAHCLHLDKDEWAILADAPGYIVQNIESNLNNRVGSFCAAPAVANIMLGTDGMHSDMLRSAKATFFYGAGIESLTMAGIYDRFRAVHRYTAQNRIPGDGDNNLVVLDYDSPTPVSPENFLAHLIYGIESCHVHSVISSGKLILENRRLLTVDENEILERARRAGEILWTKMKHP